MSRYHIRVMPTAACSDCAQQTIYKCMECAKAICVHCSFSMHAMCQACRAAYTGPIWQLGKRADAYIREELNQIFE